MADPDPSLRAPQLLAPADLALAASGLELKAPFQSLLADQVLFGNGSHKFDIDICWSRF